MTHRLFAALVFPTCVVACATETTSLGGPRGSQSSASSDDDQIDGGSISSSGSSDSDAADAASNSNADGWSAPAYSSPDAGPPGAWPCGYSWMPVPGAGPCEYLLPTEGQNGSRDLDPATWDPNNVRVDLWTAAPTSDPNVWKELSREIGGYEDSVDACDAKHGWYYVPSNDGTRPTSYALCPASCDFLKNDGADFRLSAFGWCGL